MADQKPPIKNYLTALVLGIICLFFGFFTAVLTGLTSNDEVASKLSAEAIERIGMINYVFLVLAIISLIISVVGYFRGRKVLGIVAGIFNIAAIVTIVYMTSWTKKEVKKIEEKNATIENVETIPEN